MRALRLLIAVAAVAAIAAPPAAAANFTHKGTVSRVVDGDTLDVRLNSGKTERVRLIGIDTPERGACYASKATARARDLALDERVILRGDPTQATRDRYSRLLAYVWLPGGKDLGFQLISGGFGKVYVFDKPFKRLSAYRAAEKSATGAGRGVWGACGASPAPPSPPPATNCHPSYSPCVPNAGYDLDCADIGFTVRVRGSDPYRLDGDNDGYGCE